MNILDLVVGKPIKTSDERAEQIGPAQGIPIFGLDALSSAAYGPEAALSLLIPLGLLGVRYIVPISAAIITLLVIVYFSYRQTIAAYPSGGGSYTVARFNLGAPASLLAAAALLADYILTAAVGISAGVGALVSAVPSLLPHTVSLCVGILIVITILNLRGVREAGAGLRGSHLSLCRHASHHHRRGRCPRSPQRRPSNAGRAPSASAAHDRSRQLLAAAQSLRQRLHGLDRRGGRQQRRESLPRARREERPAHSHGHYFSSGGAAGGNFLSREESTALRRPIPASPATRACSPCSSPRFSAKAFSTT